MKVVCPWTQLHPPTRVALDSSGFPIEYEYVGEDEYAYPRLVARLWEGNCFCLVEHDVEVHPETLHDFFDCEHGYCAAPFEWSTNLGPALGATRFSDAFLAQFPTAAEEAQGVTFRQFDYQLMRVILLRVYGQAPHLHLPPVIHHNPAQALVPPWDTWTVEEHLNSLGWAVSEDGRTADWTGSGGYS